MELLGIGVLGVYEQLDEWVGKNIDGFEELRAALGMLDNDVGTGSDSCPIRTKLGGSRALFHTGCTDGVW